MTNQELLEKFARNTATAEETELFWKRLQTLSMEEAAILMEQYELLLKEETEYGMADKYLLQKMQQRVAAYEQPPRKSFIRTYWAAASVVLAVCIGGYFLFPKSNIPSSPISEKTQIIPEIEPGREGAILTLSDGRQMVLDSVANGQIARQNGTVVVLNSGKLVYDQDKTDLSENEPTAYNTITTPKGRQFSLQLPDGTRVWLNAASSMRYPTAFNDRERRVEVSGEAYFEVMPDKNHPFRISINGKAETEVLGTSFNINAYHNEETINTTLIEGSIRVFQTGSSETVQPDQTAVLRPGQQARISKETPPSSGKEQSAIRVLNADIDKVVAWKNGAFNFDNVGLRDAMKQLERWYNIEVVYEGKVPDIHFVGKMSRDIQLSGLLRILEESEVHFRMEEGRRLVVLP